LITTFFDDSNIDKKSSFFKIFLSIRDWRN
jgi:hypothetical protein